MGHMYMCAPWLNIGSHSTLILVWWETQGRTDYKASVHASHV